MMLEASWQPPQERKSAFLAELLAFRPSGQLKAHGPFEEAQGQMGPPQRWEAGVGGL